ncbi:MAG: hypothetical protein EOO63_00975 [Hymenobacter sp.]|nr:MAG: hypothetical protein EOO63_00975 [Hymenobacter sp.]
MSLPVPAASPVAASGKTYAVQTQMLATVQVVAVQLGLRAAQGGFDKLKQVARARASWRKIGIQKTYANDPKNAGFGSFA